MILEATTAAQGIVLPDWAMSLLIPAMVLLVGAFFRWNVAQDKAIHKVELHIANESATKDDLKELRREIRRVLEAVNRLEGRRYISPRRPMPDEEVDDDA